MIEWKDEAIVLGARPHGEGNAVLIALGATKGLWRGLVRGGASRRMAPVLQPGNTVEATWRARLEDQLGQFTVEPVAERASALMGTADALAGLNAVCALAAGGLPEREPMPGPYAGLAILLDRMDSPELWPALMVRWEMGLLEALGFGLDLSRCAVTGSRDGLTHVSPRTGRAVCADAATPYLDKLLPLPPFLLSRQMSILPGDVRDGLLLTGHFLARHVFAAQNRPLPEARLRLADRFAEQEQPPPIAQQ